MARDVALIVIDTLRWDYSRIFDEAFKKFTKIKGVATAPWTFPSHVSFLTGLTLSAHGIFEKNYGKSMKHYFNPWEWDSLPKYFRMEGYDIKWITCNPYLSKPFGFDGFDEMFVVSDHFADIDGGTEEDVREKTKKAIARLKDKLSPWYLEKGVKNVKRIVEGMERTNDTFLFINLMEVHDPYMHNDPYYAPEKMIRAKTEGAEEEAIKIWRNGYPRTAIYLDEHLKDLLKILEEKMKDPLIVVISDHGQLLGEYKRLGHEIWLYDELTHVPVWVNEKVDAEKISLVDIPRMIEALVEGKAFTPSEYFFSESYGPASYPDSAEELVEKYKEWRIAVENNKGKIVFNADKGEIEWQRGSTEGLLKKIKKYVEDPGAFSPGL